jgi:hypothetical protein
MVEKVDSSCTPTPILYSLFLSSTLEFGNVDVDIQCSYVVLVGKKR